MSDQRQQIIPLRGGLDLVTPAMMMDPGAAIAGLNYEPEARGYARAQGHERYDGQPAPSNAFYDVLLFDAGTAAIAAGQTVTGLVSGATGVALVAGILTTGTYGGGTATGTLVLHSTVGAFVDNEALQVGGVTRATANGTASRSGASDDVTSASYIALETARRRALIAGPPGSGPIRGVASYRNQKYAWRDNAGGTAGQMFKSTSTGWVSVATTLPAGATVRAIVHNFLATAAGERLYFVTTTGRAFEWDGTALNDIDTGMGASLDKPTHLAVHKDHLFLAFPGGSLQGSATGDPHDWTVLNGAVEFGFGQDITGLKSETNDSLVITGRNKLGYLIGADAAEYQLKTVSESSGAVEDTLEVVGRPIFLDDQGVRDMTAAEAYGDWRIGTLTQMVEPIFKTKKAAGARVAGRLRVRAKDQYRLYWDDRTGIIIYFGRKTPEVMPISLGFVPTCLSSAEDEEGNEFLLAGGANGMVYHLDRGTSFDGATLDAYLRLPFAHQGAPNMMKRYHRARLEGRASEGSSAISMAAEFSYGSEEQPASLESGIMFFGSGGFWDEANWNAFDWSAPVEGQAFADIDGIGENISILFLSSTLAETPHALSTLTINWTPRRRLR